VTPPRSKSSSQEHLLASTTDETTKAPNHNVTIAVVDTSSLEENKKPLTNSDSWAEEFNQLEGLVNTLKDTVTSIASLPQLSPSPDPLPSPKTTPLSATDASPSGALVIDNLDTASQGTTEGAAMQHDEVADETVLENNLINIDNDDDHLSDKDEIQAGSAKREENFAPRVFGDKVLYPLMESDVSLTSSQSSVSSTSGHKEPLTTSNEQSEEVELQGHFIELLQFGDRDDLHMVSS